jgi:hypothetical protein
MGRIRTSIRIPPLILALLGTAGCYPPGFRYGHAALPTTDPPRASEVTIGRRAVVVVDRSGRHAADVEDVELAILPPQATVHRTVRARIPGQMVEAELTIGVYEPDGKVVALVSDSVAPQGEMVLELAPGRHPASKITVTWTGRPPSPDALQVTLEGLCVGDSCEDLRVDVPMGRAAAR